MIGNPIQMKDVLRHQQNSYMVTEASYSDYMIISNSISKGKIEKNVLESYLAKSRGDGSKENVLRLLQLESNLEKENMDSIIPYFTNEIVPHVKDMNDLLVKVEGININEDKKESIRESVKDAKVINRINKNHEVITKNLNLQNEVRRYEITKESEIFINSICETVSKLSAPQYAKLNIALEEVLYDNYKYGLAIPKKYCIETVVDYFLFSPFDKETLNEYCRLLKENRCISYSDCENINYLFESEKFADPNDIRDLINKYKKDENKTATKLEKVIRKVYGTNPDSIINETPTLFGVIRTSLLLPTFAISPVLGILAFMTDRFIQFGVRRNQADRMLKYFTNELNKVEDQIDACFDNEKKEEKLKKYYNCLDKCNEKILMYRNKMYTDDELEKEMDFEESFKYVEPMRLNEFKEYKFNNLMDVMKYAGKYINTVYGRASKIVKDKFNKSIFRPIGESDIVTESNLLAHIDQLDNRVSICIEAFEFNDVDFAHNEMTRLCKALNASTSNPKYLFFYEYAADNRMELYLKEATPIALTDKEEKEQASMFAGIDFNRICDIQVINELMNNKSLLESFVVLEDVNIKEKVSNAANKVKDTANSIKDGATNKVDVVKDKLTRSQEIGEGKSKKDKGLKGINLNSIRLALEGSKKKAKDLSAKEQEVSRQLDYTANHFVKSVEQTMTSDRREGLIKGSVIPSFSKSLKWCIGLGIVGSFNPGLAMIAALGALANSKRLNYKERALLLDEIEIELKVVEKEISMAESDNNMKKLRTLMQYQKSLQREYQRLKYNMKVHWKTPDGRINTNVTHNTIGRNYGIKGGDD